MKVTRFMINVAAVFLIVVLILGSIYGFQRLRKPAFSYDNAKVVQKWATADTFSTPESVCYDKKADVLYVSNTSNKPNVEIQALGNGFISKLSKDGKVINLKWVTGINSPKGLGILGRKLYAADVTCVREIDIDKGVVVKTYDAPNSEFLNDISVDQDTKTVYISDMNKNKIFAIKDGKLELWLQSDSLKHPNGVFAEGDHLYVGTTQLSLGVIKVNFKSKNISHYIDNTTGIDGLVPDGNGNILISDWFGTLHITNPTKPMIGLLDLRGNATNIADFEYIKDLNLIVIPTFFNNRVIAYELQ